MAISEDVIRLKVEATGLENLDALKTKVSQVQAEIYEFADSYNVVETAAQEASAVISRTSVRPFWASDESTAATRRAAEAIEEVNTAAQKTHAGTSLLQQRITAASYAFQDFTSTGGDLGQKLNSISNNIPQLLAGFGGLATGISLAVTAGIAIYRNWDEIAGLFTERNPIPKVEGDVKGLEAALKANNKELDDLKSKTSLSNTELGRFNELTEKQVSLEKELSDARETERNRQAHGALSDTVSKERAQFVTKEVEQAGGYEKVVADLTRQAQEEQGVKDTDVTRLNAIRDSFQKVLNDAMKGDEKALSALRFYTSRATGGGAATSLDIGLEAMSPEAVAQRKKEDDAEKERQKEEEKAAKARQKAEEDKAKLTDELSAQGQENYRLAQEEEAKRREKEQNQAERERDQTARAQEQAQVRTGRAAQTRVAEQARGLQAGSIDERAAAFALQLRAQGATAEQTQDRLRAAIGGELGRTTGLNALQRSALTSRLTGQAMQSANQAVTQQQGMLGQQAQLSGRTLGAAELNTLAVHNALNQMEQLAMRVEGQARQNFTRSKTRLRTAGH